MRSGLGDACKPHALAISSSIAVNPNATVRVQPDVEERCFQLLDTGAILSEFETSGRIFPSLGHMSDFFLI